MSYAISSSSTNGAFLKALKLMCAVGEVENSRNGRVLALTKPIMVEYTNPLNRVLLSPVRDANPFFHLFESMWMLDGRNDVAFVKQFNSNIANYSDDGVTFHGAYGYRWRNHFGMYELKIDQIAMVIEELKNDPNSRRAVVSMWDPVYDLGRNGKDLPCNTHIYFRIVEGKLNMTVCNRSNDVIWGMFGANSVHMSFLQEFVAGSIGLEIGSYFQISNNAHLYIDTLMDKGLVLSELMTNLALQDNQDVITIPMGNPKVFIEDCKLFLNNALVFKSEFFNKIVLPMIEAWNVRKSNPIAAIEIINQAIIKYGEVDWLVASLGWLVRRVK